MIRTFRVFTLADIAPASAADTTRRIEGARLRGVLRGAPALLQKRISTLADLLRDERISVNRTQAARWDLSLTGTWPSRPVTVAAGRPPRIRVLVNVWFLRTSGWLVVFEAARPLAEAVAYIIGGTLTHDLRAVTALTPDPGQWKQLFKWAQHDKAEQGGVLGGKFYKTSAGGADFEWLSMRLSAGSSRRLLGEAFGEAEGVGELLLATPRLSGLADSITCRVSRGGVFRIYASEVSDSVVESLLVELARLWAPAP